MYVRIWTRMDDPTRRDAPLVLHKHFQALLTRLFAKSLHRFMAHNGIIGTGSESPSMAGLQALILPFSIPCWFLLLLHGIFFACTLSFLSSQKRAP